MNQPKNVPGQSMSWKSTNNSVRSADKDYSPMKKKNYFFFKLIIVLTVILTALSLTKDIDFRKKSKEIEKRFITLKQRLFAEKNQEIKFIKKTASPSVKIKELSGEVLYKTEDSANWEIADKNTPISEWSSLKTKNGMASLLFFDNSVVRMDKDSKIKIGRLSENKYNPLISLELLEGRVWNRVINILPNYDFKIKIYNSYLVKIKEGGVLVSGNKRKKGIGIKCFDSSRKNGGCAEISSNKINKKIIIKQKRRITIDKGKNVSRKLIRPIKAKKEYEDSFIRRNLKKDFIYTLKYRDFITQKKNNGKISSDTEKLLILVNKKINAVIPAFNEFSIFFDNGNMFFGDSNIKKNFYNEITQDKQKLAELIYDDERINKIIKRERVNITEEEIKSSLLDIKAYILNTNILHPSKAVYFEIIGRNKSELYFLAEKNSEAYGKFKKRKDLFKDKPLLEKALKIVYATGKEIKTAQDIENIMQEAEKVKLTDMPLFVNSKYHILNNKIISIRTASQKKSLKKEFNIPITENF